MQTQNGWRQVLNNFAQQSSIHALKYVASMRPQCRKEQIRRPLSERIFWSISLLASAACFSIFLIHLLSRWDRGPLFVGLAEKSQPIWDIPFPAITICPETKAKTAIVNFTDAYHIIMKAHRAGQPNNLSDET